MTQYIDFDALEAIDVQAFRNQRPYPWANPERLLTDAGYEALRLNMPEISLFEQKFGYKRRAGQKPHDRYSLEYEEGMPVPQPWIDFIGELRSDRYRNAIARLFNAHKPEFRFHWHYAPSGCSVSPHCDAKREHGSHLFYFNSDADWQPDWGGETLVLDDGGSMDPDSAPAFEDFKQIITCKSLGNVSAILERSDRGWHGVRKLTCPEGQMRKIFIVVVNPDNLFWKVRDKMIGKKIHRF
jgi:hypothetical protein